MESPVNKRLFNVLSKLEVVHWCTFCSNKHNYATKLSKRYHFSIVVVFNIVLTVVLV